MEQPVSDIKERILVIVVPYSIRIDEGATTNVIILRIHPLWYSLSGIISSHGPNGGVELAHPENKQIYAELHYYSH